MWIWKKFMGKGETKSNAGTVIVGEPEIENKESENVVFCNLRAEGPSDAAALTELVHRFKTEFTTERCKDIGIHEPNFVRQDGSMLMSIGITNTNPATAQGVIDSIKAVVEACNNGNYGNNLVTVKPEPIPDNTKSAKFRNDMT